MPDDTQRWRWVTVMFVLILAAFSVPFILLNNVTKMYGAFLFWCLFAVVAILCIGRITSRWED